MFLRTVVVILLICVFSSCDKRSFKSTTNVSTTQLLDTVIDYTSVDTYPLFTNCENLTDKKTQLKCFEDVITEELSAYFTNIEYKVREVVNDSTYVDLLINNNGKTKIVAIRSPQVIKNNLPQLDSILTEAVDQLPIVKPALKRGIPVKSQYKLTIIVRTD